MADPVLIWIRLNIVRPKGASPVKKFNPSSNHPDRALQAWQILIAAAMNRQTLTYKGLSQLMYRKDAAGVLDKILGHIAFFCSDNKLPALTSIVVGKGRGTPGADIPVNPKVMDREREKDMAMTMTGTTSTHHLQCSFQCLSPVTARPNNSFKPTSRHGAA
jgi:hypothetical protein